MQHYKNPFTNLATIVLFSFLLFTSLIPWRSSIAQSQTSDQTWTNPVNLSHSGSTTNPSIVVDSNGIIHVVWEDKIAGEMYTSYDGTKWSNPVATNLPFGAPPSSGAAEPGSGNRLKLIADNKGYVHAFWVDQNDQLHYSRVLGSLMDNGANWDSQQILANSAVDYDVALDNQDRIHLSYVRAIDESGFPAGIYYRQSDATGGSWGNPDILYQSQYFRSLTNQNANVSITTDKSGAGQNVYVAWDNRPRKQVFFSRSTDGGTLWSDPSEIDKPDASNGFASPFNIRVATDSQGILLEWQVGDPASSCTQNYQWSTDAGKNWSDRQQMLDQLGACSQENQYFESSGGVIFLAATVQTQIYFLAWNGSEWSDPQPQSELSGFQDPETYDQVIFDCRNVFLNSNNSIIVVGCDTGVGGDIWLTSRQSIDTNSWFTTSHVWSKSVRITSGQQDLQNPIILADHSGNMHAFWTQIDTSLNTSAQYAGIFYSRWDGQNWSPPTQILSSPDGDIVNPSVVIDSSDVFYITWAVDQTGVVEFSRVNANRANNPAEWLQPVNITSGNEIVASPKIFMDSTGFLSIIYAIPINENRGIYMIQSSNKGDTWTSPSQIFDGGKAGWDQVGLPQVTRGSDGQFHAIWSQIQFGKENEGLNLYYSRSADGGKTWSEPDSVIETSIDWSDIVAISGNEIHRFWLENQAGRRILWYESTKDNGINWSRPEGVSYFGGSISSVNLALDPGLNPFLLQITQDSFGKIILNDWLWNSDSWSASDPLPLSEDNNLLNEDLSAVISPKGKLGVLYTSSIIDPANNVTQYSMDFVDRSIQISSTITSPSPSLTLATSAPATDTPQAITSATQQPTPALSVNSLDIGKLGPTPSSYQGLIVAIGLAGLIVLFTIGYGLLRRK